MCFFRATRFLQATLLGVASAAWLALPVLGLADETPTPAEIARLVADLGSKEYSKRQQATAELIAASDEAFEAVEAATKSPDHEVSYRAERILSMIAQQDQKRRIEAFLRRENLRQPLAFWSDALAVMGDSDNSRRLFASMHEVDGELLEMAVREPKQIDAALRDRSAAIMQRTNTGNREQAPLAQIAAIALVTGSPTLDVSLGTEQTVLNLFLQQSMRSAMSDEKQREPCKALLSRVIQNVSVEASYQALRIAMDYDMPEGLTVARKLLADDALPHTHFKQMALMTVFKLGTKEDLPQIEKLLDNKQVIGRVQMNKVIHELQMRDAALLAAVKLAGLKVEDYFAVTSDQLQGNPQAFFMNPRTIGFENDTKRDEAVKRYRDAQTAASEKK